MRRVIQEPAKKDVYARFTREQRAAIEKRAAEHTIAATNMLSPSLQNVYCTYLMHGGFLYLGVIQMPHDLQLKHRRPYTLPMVEVYFYKMPLKSPD